jgi:hypothetical protein
MNKKDRCGKRTDHSGRKTQVEKMYWITGGQSPQKRDQNADTQGGVSGICRKFIFIYCLQK